jgi:hypothetical protein
VRAGFLAARRIIRLRMQLPDCNPFAGTALAKPPSPVFHRFRTVFHPFMDRLWTVYGPFFTVFHRFYRFLEMAECGRQ